MKSIQLKINIILCITYLVNICAREPEINDNVESFKDLIDIESVEADQKNFFADKNYNLSTAGLSKNHLSTRKMPATFMESSNYSEISTQRNTFIDLIIKAYVKVTDWLGSMFLFLPFAVVFTDGVKSWIFWFLIFALILKVASMKIQLLRKYSEFIMPYVMSINYYCMFVNLLPKFLSTYVNQTSVAMDHAKSLFSDNPVSMNIIGDNILEFLSANLMFLVCLYILNKLTDLFDFKNKDYSSMYHLFFKFFLILAFYLSSDFPSLVNIVFGNSLSVVTSLFSYGSNILYTLFDGLKPILTVFWACGELAKFSFVYFLLNHLFEWVTEPVSISELEESKNDSEIIII